MGKCFSEGSERTTLFPMSKAWKRTCAVFGLAGVLAALSLLPFDRWLEPLFGWILSNGEGAAKWLFIGIGVVAVVLFVPVTVPIAAAGALFGFPGGLWPAGAVLAAGSALGFLAGRRLWPRIRECAPFRDPVFAAIRQAVEEEGYVLLALLRMTPFMHFMTGNLFLGSLKLRFAPYLLASLLGMVPGTLLVVYGGSVAGLILADQSGLRFWQWGLLGLGIALFLGISWRVKQRVGAILEQSGKGE